MMKIVYSVVKVHDCYIEELNQQFKREEMIGDFSDSFAAEEFIRKMMEDASHVLVLWDKADGKSSPVDAQRTAFRAQREFEINYQIPMLKYQDEFRTVRRYIWEN